MKCSKCKRKIVKSEDSFEMGYATNVNGDIFCYPCCGKLDKEYMLTHNKITLYLCENGKVTNWPNSLSFDTIVIERGHNWWYVKQNYVWFIGPGGALWLGRNVTGGYNELCHCRKLKTKSQDHWAGRALLRKAERTK